jgi:adenylate cyclase
MKEFIKKYSQVTPLKITIFVIFLSLILFFFDFPFLHFMELKTLDLRISSRGALPTGGETIIAVVDEKSLSELGRWPWPRTTIARLIDKLKASGAKAVGFDVVFSEPDDNSSLKTIAELSSEMKKSGVHNSSLAALLNKKKATADTDTALARSIARAKNVTLGYFFHLSNRDTAYLSEKTISAEADNINNSRYQIINSQEKNPDDSSLLKAYAPEANLKIFSSAAANSGYFNMVPDTDGSMRWAPLVIKFRNNYYSSLPLSILQQYLDWPQLTLNMAGYGTESIKLADITIPTDESGRLLVNYLGPAKTFPHYSISDILQGKIPADKIRGKIVLVGATAIGIYDLRVTPFGATYPGVEIHANVIDNILHRNFLMNSSFTRFIDLCTIIVFGLLMGLIIPRLRAVTGIFFAVSILMVFMLINMFIFVSYNVWLNVVYPALTMAVIYLAITVYRYITEEREKKKIRGAFQYYLTASVMNEILKDPSKLKLGGAKKNLTVMFSDIRGFTTIAEGLTPDQLVHLLNEYLTAMTDIVFKYDGLLDKYIGDAIMAVWGDPIDQPDHPLRACRTALEMMEKLKTLQVKWAAEGWPSIDIGIGINTGDMTVGNMGSLMRFDYTVMGDMVNLSSRLEGINKEYGTHIVISEFTYNTVKDQMFCRELDSVRVKGKKLPVKIYELLAEKKDAAPLESFGQLFEEALGKYKQAKWDDAIAAFQQVLALRPDDPTSKIYVERCRTMKEHPPEGEWDGVFTMTRK